MGGKRRRSEPKYVERQLSCGHWVRLQADTLRRRRGRGQPELPRCKCLGPASSYFMAGLQELEQLGEALAFECTVIPEWSEKRLDYFFLKKGVGAEMDGQHHFGQGGFGRGAWEQYDLDRLADDVFEEARLRVVRLHYADRSEWGAKVREALAGAGAPVAGKYVTYTSSYAREAQLRAQAAAQA